MKTTKRSKAYVKRNYTGISYAPFDHKWDAYLKVNGQSFRVCTPSTKTRALWFRRMLVIALRNLINRERARKT